MTRRIEVGKFGGALRLLFVVAMGLTALRPGVAHAQFSGDNQTNTISTTVNWPGSYYVGSNYVNDLLQILSGGVLTNGFGYIGYTSAGDNNTALVSGGVWSNSSNLEVGWLGSGNQLVVTNGGKVFNNVGAVGEFIPGSNNVAVITGGGSVWSNRSSLYVGSAGGGNQLFVTNGGAVFNSYGTIGNQADNNVVTVSGSGALWYNSRDLYVGYFHDTNNLNIGGGGSVIASNTFVGFIAGADGNKINVTGGDLIVTNPAANSVLDIRRGMLTLDGGTVTVDKLFATNGASSVINFNGGTIDTKNTTVANGSALVVGDGIQVATLHLNGGTHSFANGLQISSNAILSGNGTLVGDITQVGTLAPGNSPGTMTVDGNLTFSNTATFEVQLGGTTQGSQYDFVDVTTNALLDGTLSLTFVSGFQTSVLNSDIFTNLTAGVSLSGAFNNILSGNRLNTADGYGSFLVTYNDGSNLILSEFLASAIPEPSTAFLAVIAAGAMALRRRNRGN